MKPYDKTQKIPLVGLQDRRRKLTEEDRADILRLYQQEKLAVRAIARLYAHKCSRRLIIFVIHPQRLQAMQKKHKDEQHWRKYYNREKLTQAVRNWRNYKYKLFKDKL